MAAKQTKRRSYLRIIFALLASILIAFGIFAVYLYTHSTYLPVLIYHHFDTVSPDYLCVTDEHFEAQIQALTQAGYHTVTTQQLIEYIDQGTPLPDKPIVLTMDDGYLSNLTIAAPILEEYDQHAVIFAIGSWTEDEDAALSGDPPYFYLSQTLPYIATGVIDVQSHSFQLHDDEFGRTGMRPMAGEDERAYRDTLAADCARERALFQNTLGYTPTSLAYPYGAYTSLTDRILDEQGIRVTYAGERGYNFLRPGHPQSLRKLYRTTVYDSTTPDMLLKNIRPGIHQTIVFVYHALRRLFINY